MKLVAITQRVVTDAQHGERRDALAQDWTPFLAKADLLPLPLPNDAQTARGLIETCRPVGIILSGGGDLAVLGGDTPERDQVETLAIELATASGMPLLGVCRGMQALLSHFGARLEKIEGHVRQSHPVTYEGTTRTVNSFHHFAATSVLPPLVIDASAPDGCVEAVRHRDLPKMRGIMWHPERESAPQLEDILLFKTLFGESA